LVLNILAPTRTDPELTDMVGANLQSLIPPHDESNLLGFLVGEKPNISSSPLFPFIVNLGESEKFGPPIISALSLHPLRFSSAEEVQSRKGSTNILNRTSSSSSWVFASTCSVSLTTGSNWGSCSSVCMVCMSFIDGGAGGAKYDEQGKGRGPIPRRRTKIGD